MSVRIRATAFAFILVSQAVQTPVFAQSANQPLSAEEQIAAQNFNGIDIVGDTMPSNSNNGATSGLSNGQNFNQPANGRENTFGKSMMQNGFSTQLNNQNTQLGHANAYGMNNGMNNMQNGMNGMQTGMSNCNGMNNLANTVNNGMNNGFNNGNNCNDGMMQNGFAGNDMSGANNGGIAQTIGNTIMSDPKLMQRAVGVAGAAALFGLFVSNGGVGGMMRSAGLDNTRHIRGPGGGY